MTKTIDTKQDLFLDFMIERINSTLNTNSYVIQRQTEGLGHEDSVVQLPFRGNCMNWVLGHIVSTRGRMLELLGEASPLAPQENALYATGSQPITAVEEALPLERLLANLKDSTGKIQALLHAASRESLLEVVNEENGSTRLASLQGLIWHETYHTGQFEYLRQAAGTDDKIF